jgi:hypothetical protein
LVLQQTTNLAPPIQWTVVTNNVSVSEGFNRVTLSAQDESTFYRLRLE